jgi:hypothetical protein
MKNAIFILSDPLQGGDDALGRLFNALSFASESKNAGDDVAVVFAGPGTRWPAELMKLGHPARKLYESVREVVRGASCGCAEAFGAKTSVEACGLPQLADHALAGTPGVASFRRYVADGFHTFIF